MKLLTFLKKTWAVLADLSGVVSSIILIFFALLKVWDFFAYNGFLLLIFIVLFTLSVIGIFKWFKKSISSLKTNLEDIQVKEDIVKYTNQEKTSLLPKLPSNRILNRWFNKALRDSKEWASDSCFENIILYIDIGKEKTNCYFQTHAISGWKNASKYFYVGKSYDVDEEELHYYQSTSIQNSPPFFKRYKKWHMVMQKALEAIKGNLPEAYNICIASNYTNLHMQFNYKRDKKGHTEEFEFDNGTLINLKTQRKIQI